MSTATTIAMAPSMRPNGAPTAAVDDDGGCCGSGSGGSDGGEQQKVRKEKTIFSWLIRGDNNNRLQSIGNRCNCTNEQSRGLIGQRNTDNGGFRVQTLRHLWNKRINAEQSSSSSSTSSSLAKPLGGGLRKLNKSVSCLVNAFNNARETPNAIETRTKRALSLHDCTQLGEATVCGSSDGGIGIGISITDDNILHREKDNFNKYKNAEQVAKMRRKWRRNSGGGSGSGADYWHNKSDVTNTNKQHSPQENKDNAIVDQCEPLENTTFMIISNSESVENSVNLCASDKKDRGSNDSLQTISTTSSSVRGSSGSAGGSAGGGSGERRATPRRKYSFKTHAGKSYHHHHQHHHISRRMATEGDADSGGGGAGGSSTGTGTVGGTVAKLTQQFNEIIQKDRRLLDEVKRKKGVWMSRGSHVYKIVEKPPPAPPTVAQEQQQQSEDASTVQRNIQKFEKLEKPVVPLKSNHILRKHRELMANGQRPTTLALGGRQTRQRRGVNSKVVATTGSQPVVIEPPKQLEVVREEAKSPVDITDVNINVEANVDIDEAMEATEDETTLLRSVESTEDETTLLRSVESTEDSDHQRQKLRKHRYAMIYEKFRLRSPFKKQSPPTAPPPTPTPTPTASTDDCGDAEAKILDALEVIDQKLKGLTKEGGRSTAGDEAPVEMVLSADNDFERRLLPNSSFIYQAAHKQVSSSNQLLLTQAVNVTLVNAIEGEQMIMEQKALSVVVEESIYEPIATSRLPVEPMEPLEPVDDIYQTVEEARKTTATTTNKVGWLEGYESIAGSCEAARTRSSATFDGYETFAESVATPPAITTTTIGTLGRNTTDELPELPKPNRILPKSPVPPIPIEAAASVVGEKKKTQENGSGNGDEDGDDEEQHYYADDDDENIYDTIKGCYESIQKTTQQLQPPTPPPLISSKEASTANNNNSNTNTVITRNAGQRSDSISVGSNCYESISNYQRKGKTTNCVQLSSSGSTLTISSDHKTNSLYESSLVAGLLYSGGSGGRRSSMGSSADSAGGGGGGGCGVGKRRDARSSIAASSDNSDAWVDISDGDGDGEGEVMATAAQFIVVRERFKPHRSPDWSKRIRDKRLQQKKAQSCIDDDSDHYYETLSPLGNKRHSAQATVQRTSSHHHKRNQDLPRRQSNNSNNNNRDRVRVRVHTSDDYDSFETDSDDHYDQEHQQQQQQLQHQSTNQQHDSGVDIANHRLPEPPAPQNQVYAMVRKFKDFISKKSPKGSGKFGGSQQKLYENTTQFYVECGNSKTEDIYDNSQQQQQQQAALSSSEKNLLKSSTSANEDIQTELLRNKPKYSKGLRSRIRKSFVGSVDHKQLSTLTPTRSTFYIEDPVQLGSGDLDSGFSEKASSGDIPVQPATEQITPSSDIQRFSTVTRKAKKEIKAQRRRTTIGIRPHEPPPPPPPTTSPAEKVTTSWYAECGVFKQSNQQQQHHLLMGDNEGSNKDGDVSATLSQNGNGGGSIISNSVNGGGGNSWYADSGLYQTSGISVASSSGSSGVSTGNEATLSDDLSPHSMFLNEPLYQIYSAAKLESITRDLEDHESSTDGYEEVGLHAKRTSITTITSENENEAEIKRSKDSTVRKSVRPSALQLVEPKNGPSRTLWSEIPEVINSCILPTLTPRERGLQEAKFEILTSEASYLKSLNLLRRHFMNNSAFCNTAVLSARDRKALFADIVPVHECSERLLTELESCWQDNIMLLGLSHRMYAIAERHFHMYIAFCEHQGRMDRTLRRLKQTKGPFQQHLEKLEASPECCGLNLLSFLMLPMQRITRLPLLIDAVFSKVSPTDDEYDSWKMTLAIMNKIVTQCNEAANLCEQAYELDRISKQLEFPSHIRALAIAPVGVPRQGVKPRYLVKRGELTQILWRGDDAKLTFGKRFTKTNIYAFLFSDLLVLTKRKGESTFTVTDYCPRSLLNIASGTDTVPQLPSSKDKDKDQSNKNLILMTLLENYERKTVELILACPSVSDQQRWLQAMRPPEAETPGEKLYESWDCPQVIAKHVYESDEPDVLNLEMGDVVNVSRKLPDGWYQGERIRDGAVGWFPGSYTEEVNSAHVRARNLKQRYRLLTFTATYLESQKRK